MNYQTPEFIQDMMDGYYPVVKMEYDDDRIYSIYRQSGEEFSVCYEFDPGFTDRLCRLGFLPMAQRVLDGYVMLPKLHHRRCVLDLMRLHVSKKVKKRSYPYTVTFNRAFDRCLDSVDRHHSPSWFFPPLRRLFSEMFHDEKYITRFCSVELWRDGDLVAGEIGYFTGAVYTSLSGFYTENSSGSVQMCALGRLLQKSGAALWDLGMYMQYKANLGAVCIERDIFLDVIAKYRNGAMVLPTERLSAAELLKD